MDSCSHLKISRSQTLRVPEEVVFFNNRGLLLVGFYTYMMHVKPQNGRSQLHPPVVPREGKVGEIVFTVAPIRFNRLKLICSCSISAQKGSTP